MHDVRVKFYLRQKQDYSLGDSTSDSSKKLFQRGRGHGQYMCDFGEGGAHEIRDIVFFFLRRFLLVMREQSSPRRILVLF